MKIVSFVSTNSSSAVARVGLHSPAGKRLLDLSKFIDKTLNPPFYGPYCRMTALIEAYTLIAPAIKSKALLLER